MNYNAVISSLDVTDESELITEPVTLEEMKEYLRLQGFITDDSPSTSITDFDDDDSLIEELITAAREYLEQRAGLSIVPHTWEVVLTNLSGRIELPYGPVIDIVSLYDSNGTAIDTYTISGNLWKYLVSPNQKDMVITYNAGFGDVLTTTLPKGIVLSIKRMVAYLYEHRGDEASEDQIRQKADSLCSVYSRNSAWA